LFYSVCLFTGLLQKELQERTKSASEGETVAPEEKVEEPASVGEQEMAARFGFPSPRPYY
jgi:hypothetical protein